MASDFLAMYWKALSDTACQIAPGLLHITACEQDLNYRLITWIFVIDRIIDPDPNPD